MMLRWIRLLYFVAHTSGYVGYVFCTSLHIRQGTLETSSVLRCTYFMLRWMHSLYFLARTPGFVGYVFCTSLHILQGTLATSSLLPCARFMLCWIRLVYFLAPKVLSHTGTIDSCWKACRKLLPSSLSSQSPMIMTYVKAWHGGYVDRKENVCNITAKTESKLG